MSKRRMPVTDLGPPPIRVSTNGVGVSPLVSLEVGTDVGNLSAIGEARRDGVFGNSVDGGHIVLYVDGLKVWLGADERI